MITPNFCALSRKWTYHLASTLSKAASAVKLTASKCTVSAFPKEDYAIKSVSAIPAVTNKIADYRYTKLSK